MELTDKSTDALILGMRAKGWNDQADYLELLSDRIAALEAERDAEHEHADALADKLREVEWSSIGVGEEKYGPWCEWCGSYKENSGHAFNCGRQDILRAHDVLRAAQPEPEAGAS